MSIEAVSIALHHSRTRGTTKLVLLGIANHDGDGGAWPSVATLAKYANVTQRNIQKALRELEAVGEIRTHRQAGGVGRMADHDRPNLYEVLITCPATCDRTKSHRELPPVASDTPGASDATPLPLSDATPEPSLEPSTEPSTGSFDPWASQPEGEQARRKPRKTKPRKLTQAEMDADYALIEELCRGELQDDPVSVWWTLKHDHGAMYPGAWMKRLVEFGEWRGFVGSHEINKYRSDGEAA